MIVMIVFDEEGRGCGSLQLKFYFYFCWFFKLKRESLGIIIMSPQPLAPDDDRLHNQSPSSSEFISIGPAPAGAFRGPAALPQVLMNLYRFFGPRRRLPPNENQNDFYLLFFLLINIYLNFFCLDFFFLSLQKHFKKHLC